MATKYPHKIEIIIPNPDYFLCPSCHQRQWISPLLDEKPCDRCGVTIRVIPLNRPEEKIIRLR